MTKISYLRMRPGKAALFLLGLGIALASCTKPEDEIGIAVQPAEDQLNLLKVDTSTITAYTVDEDSLPANNFSTMVLGSYTDPEFGFVEASFYSQLRLSAFLDTVDMAFTAVDSVVLSLALENQFYGHLDEQRFKVYEMNELLSIDSIYYSNRAVDHLGVDMIKPGYNLLTPDPNDGFVVGPDTLNPMLRFRIEESVGVNILTGANNGHLASQEAFVDFFKGIYVFPDNNIPAVDYGAIVNITPGSADTKMTIYYRHTEPGLEDTLTLDLVINEDAIRAGKFLQDYTGTNVETHLNNAALGQQTLFVQSLGGVKAVLKFPHLQNLIDSGMIAINKAELVIPVNNDLTTDYLPHERLFVYAIPDDGSSPGDFTPDFFEGDTHYDGFWEPSTNNYRIKLTRWIQQILTGEIENYGLYLVSTSSGVSANRTVIHGPEDVTDQIKLELFYTTY